MIPLFAPVRQNEPFLAEFETRLQRLLRSGEYILGRAVSQVEEQLTQLSGYQFAIGCGNGTDALVLALRSLPIPPGSEVLTPAFSFIASASAVVWAGMEPRFADVDPTTQNATVETIEAALTPQTRAIVVVDLYGRQAPIAALRELCEKRGIYLIEDGAQSMGVPKAGKGAHLFTTSFYPTKNIGTIGDGGAVMTDEEPLALAVREMTRHGGLVRDTYNRVGTTSRLDTLHAEILATKFPQTERWSQERRRLAQRYQDALGHLPSSLVELPALSDSHVWALYTVRLFQGRRNAVLESLKNAGVGSAVYYPKALPDQKALAAYKRGPFPQSEALAQQVLSIPFYPELSEAEINQILGAFCKAVEF